MTVAKRYRYLWKPLAFIAALTPALLMLAGGFGIAGRRLGTDPVEDLLLTCGKTALNLLCLTLAVTPVARSAHQPQLLRLRRMLGLFAFFYVLLHFAVYLVLDRGLDVAMIVKDITKRPYITIGFVALVLLIPLAATSTQRMMRRLGRRWQTLHRLIYPISILAAWHFYWQVKRDVTEPLIYAAIIATLLGWRVWHRQRRKPPAPVTSTYGSATAPERT
ncbi:MAG TPA: protein-methionine-sulfoxide reductase heme-binding subunit MsrQ [Steroidobacteraceae bacterium]|nr:sulfoxide reductase heme-binding subunit YedZ [Steroidobacteraceae bacterium]HQW09305.1 protein-methionine-sulfoxide reductase heme-binding subunit MsrQ [Steroidobacteraceae bacterium]HQX78143.1 protein-methionine-sulfoxide reductase heme-binding subunit MsrQ [Steroidobacteraceae bacterium]HQZ79093.1 protein-methionine-sulfoxide reductase heme-binding subunit MsrQ [Steroidobacteraceae bacterium]